MKFFYFKISLRIWDSTIFFRWFITVFNFTRPLGGFSSGENCFSAAVNHTTYGASTKLLLSILQTCKGVYVFKISVIVHNTYCVKCSKMFSLLHSWLYWYLPEKSSHLLADSLINNSWSRLNWLIIRRYFALLVSSRSFAMVLSCKSCERDEFEQAF